MSEVVYWPNCTPYDMCNICSTHDSIYTEKYLLSGRVINVNACEETSSTKTRHQIENIVEDFVDETHNLVLYNCIHFSGLLLRKLGKRPVPAGYYWPRDIGNFLQDLFALE